jgi:hypothetical protein
MSRILIFFPHFLKKYKTGIVIGVFIALLSLITINYYFDCSGIKGLGPETAKLCAIFYNDLIDLILMPFMFLGSLIILFFPHTLELQLFMSVILFGTIGAFMEKLIRN